MVKLELGLCDVVAGGEAVGVDADARWFMVWRKSWCGMRWLAWAALDVHGLCVLVWVVVVLCWCCLGMWCWWRWRRCGAWWGSGWGCVRHVWLCGLVVVFVRWWGRRAWWGAGGAKQWDHVPVGASGWWVGSVVWCW